jgi:retinol dehydrogenase-12
MLGVSSTLPGNPVLLTCDAGAIALSHEINHRFPVSFHYRNMLLTFPIVMGCLPKLTKEGYEIQMGTNHIGHSLLLKLLTPLLLKTAKTHPVRVVSLASSAWKHVGPEKIQFETLKALEGVTPVMRYVQSKTANMLYAQEFARHYPELTTVSIDPGEVATQLFSREPGDKQMAHLQTVVAPKVVQPVEEGVKNQLWAGTVKNVTSGLHYEPIGVNEPSGLMLDTDLAKKLWEWTEKELKGQEI